MNALGVTRLIRSLRLATRPLFSLNAAFREGLPAVNSQSWTTVIKRTKVILPSAHPFEYFRSDWKDGPQTPKILHPKPQVIAEAKPRPLYYQITLRRSLQRLPWHRKYIAGVLFRKYSPLKRYRPTKVEVTVNVNAVIFREASDEVAELILQMKEVLSVKNIWTVQEYKDAVKAMLGKRALTPTELQERRGYYVVDSAVKALS